MVIPTLGPGGAERVMTLLAANLAARGHEVALLTLGPTGADFFAVDARVQRIGLGLMTDSPSMLHGLRANVQRVRALRRIVAGIKPHAVLSFMTSTNILTLLACAGLHTRVVVSERIDPHSHREATTWMALRHITYRYADAVAVQTESAARWFRKRLGRLPPVAVVPNPVAVVAGCCKSSAQVPKPFVLAAGRLVHQKGFDVLIRAFAVAAHDCPDLRLAIAGEGPQAGLLRELVTELKLNDRVMFLGIVSGLQALMHEADVFVLSSRYEGFPNVLLEALACGLPVIATDCPGGPREILHDGEFGLLVPCEDPIALGAALRRMATDARLRTELSARAPRATAKYTVDGVVARWEQLLLAGS